MARQYRAGNQPTGSNSTTSTFTIPATAQIGDLCIAVWTVTGTAPNGPTGPTSGPTGWSTGVPTDTTVSANFSCWVYWKVLVSGDPGATVTFTAGTTRQLAGCAVVYDDTGIALTVEAIAVSATSTLPTLNTVAANCFAVAGAGSRRATGIDTWTAATGYTERLDSATDAGTGGKSHTFATKLTTVSAGTNLGGVAFTPSSGDGTEHSWVAAIKPAITSATLTPAPTTNVGVALSRQKSRTITATTETDAGKTSLPRLKSKSLVSADGSGTAVALSARKAKSLTPATEADSAVALTKTDPIWRTSAGATETDTAVTLVRAHARTLTAAIETDAAAVGYGEGGYGEGGYGGSLVRRHRRTLARGLETDDAQPLTVRKARSLIPADEADAATPLVGGTSAGPITASLIPADEADGTSVLDSRKTKSITPATEADTGTALTRLKAHSVTPAAESDAGVPLEVPTRLTVQPADETDTAPPVHRVKVRSITAATEAGTVAALTATHRRTLVVVAETDATVALTRLHAHGITPATETDEAFLLTVYDPNTPGRIISTRLRIRTAHGELSIPAAAGYLRTAESSGDLRTPAANSDLRILTAVGELR